MRRRRLPVTEIAEGLVRGVLADNRHEKTMSVLAIAVSHLDAGAIVQLELPRGSPAKDAVRARRNGWRDRAPTAPSIALLNGSCESASEGGS